MALVATAGASNANTYANLATADAYFETRPFAAAWTDADDDEKEAALLFATQILDGQRWAGSKGSTTNTALTQALSFPRQWVPTLEFDADPEMVTDYFVDTSIVFYDSTTLPPPLVRATCELALALVAGGSSDPFAADIKRIKRKVTGPLETEYFDSQDYIRGIARFPHVMRLVAHMFRNGGAIEVQRA